MISNLPLGISVSLQRLLDPLVSLTQILEDPAAEELLKAGPIEIPLSLKLTAHSHPFQRNDQASIPCCNIQLSLKS